MESSSAPRVLVVAHQTAATSQLLEAVRERAARGPAVFTLLVPKGAHGLHKVVDAEDVDAADEEAVIAKARPLLEEAAGAPVEGIVGDHNPLDAVQDAVNMHGFDEIIISTLPHRVSRWLKLDLPHKLEGLGLPITTVTAEEEAGTAA
jgi:hypothetical protein